MKKVTLLGDSIRQIGYGTKVPEMLGDEYEVCLNNNATFDKLMRDFKDTEDTHIGSSLF